MKAKSLSQKLDDSHEAKIDEEVILEKLRSSEADSIWFNEHYDELKGKYKNEWVAVFRQEVVDHHKNQKLFCSGCEKTTHKTVMPLWSNLFH